MQELTALTASLGSDPPGPTAKDPNQGSEKGIQAKARYKIKDVPETVQDSLLMAHSG